MMMAKSVLLVVVFFLLPLGVEGDSPDVPTSELDMVVSCMVDCFNNLTVQTDWFSTGTCRKMTKFHWDACKNHCRFGSYVVLWAGMGAIVCCLMFLFSNILGFYLGLTNRMTFFDTLVMCLFAYICLSIHNAHIEILKKVHANTRLQ